MLDWLKFFPFAYRTDLKPKEIRSPCFSKKLKRKWKFNDCTLHFKAPRSVSIWGINDSGFSIKRVSPKDTDILKDEWQTVFAGGDQSPDTSWIFKNFYCDEWLFVGPWFSGHQASLYANGLLVITDWHNCDNRKNLFHPRIFEAAITDYLDYRFGYEKYGRKPHYRGPLNWIVLPISNSIQAVTCDLHQIGNSSKENPALRKLLFFPITPNSFIYLTFDFGYIEIYRDELRSKPLLNLCDSIINSFRLDVGPETQSEWDKVKATCSDMSITKTFGELPWPLTVEKKPKNKKEVDITPQSVPQKLKQGRE